MPQNFVLELPVKNGLASRGDYIFWEGSVYHIADLDEIAKTIEIRPYGKHETQLQRNLIIPANRAYRIRLECHEKLYDVHGSPINIGNIVTYGGDVETRWEVIGLSPENDDLYIFSRDSLLGEFEARLLIAKAYYLRLIPSLNDKHGKLLYYDDLVLFDGENYKVGHLDIRRQTLHLVQNDTGKKEIVSSTAVELISEGPFENEQWN